MHSIRHRRKRKASQYGRSQGRSSACLEQDSLSQDYIPCQGKLVCASCGTPAAKMVLRSDAMEWVANLTGYFVTTNTVRGGMLKTAKRPKIPNSILAIAEDPQKGNKKQKAPQKSGIFEFATVVFEYPERMHSAYYAYNFCQSGLCVCVCVCVVCICAVSFTSIEDADARLDKFMSRAVMLAKTSSNAWQDFVQSQSQSRPVSPPFRRRHESHR